MEADTTDDWWLSPATWGPHSGNVSRCEHHSICLATEYVGTVLCRRALHPPDDHACRAAISHVRVAASVPEATFPRPLDGPQALPAQIGRQTLTMCDVIALAVLVSAAVTLSVAKYWLSRRIDVH